MKYYQEIIHENGNIAVDDTILVKNTLSTAGSHILEGFKSLFSAEAVERLENGGYVLSGKSCTGEFGLDLIGEFSYGAEQQGKLLGAAAELVRSGEVKAALAVDMNGTPRRAAALSGVEFLKPTYGTVSRYGVISCAASGEQIGVYAKNADGIAKIMGVIAGHDDKDGTSLPDAHYDYDTSMDVSGRRVAIIENLVSLAENATKQRISAFADALKAGGAEVAEISCDFFEAANTAWQILMSAETCNNISRYDGVKFGHRSGDYKNIDELYINSRTEGFNFLTKAVILYGSDVLSKARYQGCYEKSLKVRRIVVEELEKLFVQYDAVLLPACGSASYEAYDIKDAFGKVFAEGIFTCTANLTGFPALAGCGVQLMGGRFSESLLLSLMKTAEGER